MIYLDYAASSPLLEEAADAMREALPLFGNPSGAHEAGMRAGAELKRLRARFAELTDCEPDEVVFTSGGTEADALALESAFTTGKKQIVTSPLEHPAVLNPCKKLERNGFHTDFLAVGGNGVVSVQDAKQKISPRTALVSVQYANNELGTLQPAKELGEICREAGVPFHTDAVQAVGHVPVSFRDSPFDLLSLSAHKFGGPKGVGALLCRRGVRLSPLFPGGGQENGRRGGTESLLLIAGMTAALEASTREMKQERERISALRDRLEAGLLDLHAIPLCTAADRLPGHCRVLFPGFDGNALLHALDLAGICVSTGAACSSSRPEPSASLLAIGLDAEKALSGLRITLGKGSTDEEIGFLLDRLSVILKK